jgi:hypothetical protein
VGRVGRALSGPTQADLQAVYRILGYLRNTAHYGLLFRAPKDEASAMPLIEAYCDADFGSAETTHRRSITGFTIKVFGVPVVFKSKRQDCVAQSTCEAELVSLNLCARYTKYLRILLSEFGVAVKEPSKIHCDNQATIAVCKGGGHLDKSKHMELKHFYVQDLMENGTISLSYIKSMLNPADGFTKPLDRAKFNIFRSEISVCECPSSTEALADRSISQGGE